MDLKNAKVGSQIACNKSFSDNVFVYTVERLTKTRAVCNNGVAFLLDSGKMVGSSGWNARYGRIAEGADLEKILTANRIARANAKLRSFTVTESTLAAAEALLGIGDAK